MEKLNNGNKQGFVPDNARFAAMWLGSLTEARAVLDCCPGLRRLYLVENNADRVEKFQALPEAEPVLQDERVSVVNAGAGSLDVVLGPLFEADTILLLEGKIGVYLSDEYCAMEPELTAALRVFILDHVRAVVSASATRAVRGWHMLCNSVFNIRGMPFRNTTDSLKGLVTGRPVVIVGAGPSLDRNVAELAGSKAVIVACDSAWRALDRNGVVPDIVVTTDGDEAAWRFFAGLSEKYPDVAIVNVLRGSWTTGRYYRGALFVGRSPDEGLLARVCSLKMPVFNSGTCVGHAAFETASLLGADPVIMIGFDLGYSGARFHANDMAVPYFKDRPPEKENLVSVPGIDGNPVLTDMSMLLYLREFERRIAGFKGLVFDATEGGALIKGAQVQSLRSVLAEFCCGKPDVSDALQNLSPDPDSAAVQASVAGGLLRLAGQALDLMGVVGETGSDIEKFLSGGKEAFPALAPFDELLEIVSGTYGPNIFAGFKLAWEDWVLSGAPRPVPASLRDSAGAYLWAVREGTRILREAVLTSERSGETKLIARAPASSGSVREASVVEARKIVTAFSRGGCRETYFKVIDILRSSGYIVNEFRGDMDDVPEVWRVLRETRTGLALMTEGALYPAAWAMAGCCCLDVRRSGAGMGNLYSYWLPGYGVVCPDAETFGICRETVPYDRPAGFVKDDGMVCGGEAEISLDKYVNALFDEIV